MLENYGYFGSQAEDSLLYRKHGRKAKVYYTLRIAPPWYYSNISYPQAGGGLQPLIDSMRATSLLRVGAQYNMDSADARTQAHITAAAQQGLLLFPARIHGIPRRHDRRTATGSTCG